MKRYKGKKVVESKKIVIDDIEFKSNLEGTMYKLLKQAGIKNVYEGCKYNTFKSFKYGEECWERTQKRSKNMVDKRSVLEVKYTPDFIGENEEWFIETKGRPNESFSIRWKLFKQVMNSREVVPLLFKPTNNSDCEQVINILKDKGYGRTKK